MTLGTSTELGTGHDPSNFLGILATAHGNGTPNEVDALSALWHGAGPETLWYEWSVPSQGKGDDVPVGDDSS
jgi:hypothetical protein